ncbi:unnamed protein product [Eruca vesicaria subsp. sativa]|uniref:Uncharacterized protein n=1 Tax=Eruca vesicaria subsp. sativa TaxID=29727 RepID=A0ABC8L4I4_ERUVS|nr:unnamed protein product [Eruca vesicaria subsp. sativa]
MARLEEEIKNIGQTVTESHRQMRCCMQDMFDTFQRNIANMIPTQCSRAHTDTPHDSQADIPDNGNKSASQPNTSETRSIIQDALLFARTVAPISENVPFAGNSLN